MAPVSLVRAFGEHLGCGALLCELEKTAIGEYTEDDAWEWEDLYRAFLEADEGIIHFPAKKAEARRNYRSQRYLERVVGRNWEYVYSPPKKRKLKPYEKRLRKRRWQELEAAGLISDEDAMKQKLRKKAVKLIGNLNVSKIEEVFAQILEE